MPFTKLASYPRNRLVDEELARCRVSELELLGQFGPPTSVRDVPGGEPTFFWDLEWSCGLVADLQFLQLSELLSIRLDAPDIDHVLRHLGVPVRELWLLEEASPEQMRKVAGPVDRSWEIWREDERGPHLVATALTERDARCWCDERGDPSYRSVQAGR
jgi:hypothetical protein